MTRQLADLQASGEDINQFLEAIIQRAKKTLMQLNKDLNQKDLRIQKGRRVIHGETARGVRSDITKDDVKAISELMSQPSQQGKASEYEGKVPNYEIKLDDEVLFRCERDGTVTTNQVQLEKQQQIDSHTQQNSSSPAYMDMEDLRDAFSDQYDPDPYPDSSVDTDADKLTNSQEASINTDPDSWDTDGDGIGDGTDSHPTSNDPNQGENQEEPAVENKINRAPVLEVEDIPPALKVAFTDVEKLPQSNAKELFTTLVKEVGKKAQQLGQQAVEGIANLPTWKQNQDVASTALKLFNQNYEKTGQTRYEGVGYNISLKGLNNYEITDKNGASLMKFQKKALGVQVTQHHLSPRDYARFNHANRSLKQFEGVIDGDSRQRLARLRHLAPERDGEIIRSMNAREVEKTASQFLNYMAVEKWDAGVKGHYNIERNGKDLTIFSKADGRGVVFERKDGQIFNNLSSKDVAHFRDLNQTLEKRLSKVVGLQVAQSNKQSQLTQSQPKIKKEKELSL